MCIFSRDRNNRITEILGCIFSDSNFLVSANVAESFRKWLVLFVLHDYSLSRIYFVYFQDFVAVVIYYFYGDFAGFGVVEGAALC